MKLSTRLTLLSAGTLAMVWIIVAVVVYTGVATSGENRLDEVLTQQANQVAGPRGFSARPGARLNARTGARPTVRRGVQSGTPLPDRLSRRELLAQIIDSNGDVRRTSEPLQQLGELPVDDRPAADETAYSNATVGGVALRVRAQTLQSGRTVQVAVVRGDLDATLHRLRSLLLFSTIIVIALAAAAGRAVALAALSPVARITSAARRITSTGALTERVAEPADQGELAELSRTFDEMLERLDGQQQLQRAFIADASHELRTPLTSLRGNAEFISRDDVTTDMRNAAVADLVADIDRLDGMAGDLLVLARVDAGANVTRAPIDVSQLLEDVSARHARTTATHSISVSVPDNVAVLGDRLLLDRALDNLVVNAIQYTPAGTSITLSATQRDGAVVIDVSDDGPGMSSADAELAFRRFHRGASATGTDGTGLGLAIVKAAIESMDGTITLHSQPDHGCIFRIKLLSNA